MELNLNYHGGKVHSKAWYHGTWITNLIPRFMASKLVLSTLVPSCLGHFGGSSAVWTYRYAETCLLLKTSYPECLGKLFC